MFKNNWFSKKHHSYKQPRDEKGRFIKKPTLLERAIEWLCLAWSLIFLALVVWLEFCVATFIVVVAIVLFAIVLYVILVIIGIPIMIVVLSISSVVEFIVNNVLGFHEFHISWLHQLLDS